MIDRRARQVEIASFWIRSDQTIEVARFELVRVLGQSLQVAHAIVTCAGLEEVVEGERTQGGVATGAATRDHNAHRINALRLGEALRAVDAVLDVNNAPLAPQQVAIFPAVAAAAAVVDIEHSDSAAGPELDKRFERTPGGRGGTAVTFHEQRWPFSRSRRVVGIGRRIEQAVRSAAAARILD